MRLISYNTWLIPFAGPWFLARGAERCAPALVAAACALDTGPAERTQPATPQGADALRLALVQEGWAWRAGVAWPLFWLLGCAEGALLRRGIVRGGHELWPFAALKCLLLGTLILFNLLVQVLINRAGSR